MLSVSSVIRMTPIVTPAEMNAIDADAPESLDVLIERAGWAVFRQALSILGSTYGKRTLVLAGQGKNGADGIAAARLLRGRGVRCEVVSPDDYHGASTPPDLVIDGCVGTGLNRDFRAPLISGAPVLAIDIPSGIDGTTGEVRGSAIRADRTITLGAVKPGLLLGDGPDYCGEIVVDGLGLDCSVVPTRLVGDDDVRRDWPVRARQAHKWQSSVLVVGGSVGMTGALSLAGEAAARAGAGLVGLGLPGQIARGHREAIALPLPAHGWDRRAALAASRYAAVVVGPGLDSQATVREGLTHLLSMDRPLVLDAGSLDAAYAQASILRDRKSETVLTPHEGEFSRLTGEPIGPDRIVEVRKLADFLQCTILLKGPTTIVSCGDQVRVVTSGDQRLATAGTGDVLSGIIGAGLAAGVGGLTAASLGAHVHGRSGCLAGFDSGLIASDLLPQIPRALTGQGVPSTRKG